LNVRGGPVTYIDLSQLLCTLAHEWRFVADFVPMGRLPVADPLSAQAHQSP